MTEIERLTELIMNSPKIPVIMNGRAQGRTYQTARNIADHLLANGVIVPPCKVGDYVHFKGLEEPWIVSTINFYKEGAPQISITSKTGKVTTTMTFSKFSEFAVVLTREETEKAFEERSKI